MINNLVSIITPCYNSEKFISKTIESVLAQTYTNWEMIIVDDCSNDNSVQIIKDYMERDRRIKLIKLEKNSGPAVARNVAIKEARGRYIAFLDSDDLWKPEKLEKQINFMTEHKLAFTYSSYEVIDENNKYITTFSVKEVVSYIDLLKTNIIGCLTAIYDTKKLGKMCMPEIKNREDYGLWLKIMKKIKITKGLIEPLAVYRIKKNSVSSNKIKMAKYQWKVYREYEKLNFLKSVYYFLNYVYYGLKKYR